MTTTTRCVIAILGLLCLAAPARAQDAEPDTSAWKRQLIGKLSLTQAGFRNWADGGTNTLAASTGLDGRFERTDGPWTQLYEFRAGFGFIRQDTLDFRKAEDLIVLKASFEYAGDGFFHEFKPTALLSARSQFYEGFDYKKMNPDGSAPKVSDALSPATLVEQFGLTYDSTPWMTHNLGVAAKQTVVLLDSLRELYNLNPDHAVRFEMGLGLVTDVDADVVENVHYRSTLGLFAAFNQPDSPDILWENALMMKVNSWLTTNVEWTFVLDKDRSDALQMRETLSISIAYHFL